MPGFHGRRLATALVFMSAPLVVLAAGVSVKFDLSNPDGSPFPTDRFTVRDWSQNTYRRVNLPKPNCAARPSDCADIEVLNTLDGFSTQPRITVPFTGDIDVGSVNSDTVYLVNLGDTQTFEGIGQKVGINQILWDPATRTLVFEPDALLNQHSRYVLIITDGVRDASGKPIKSDGFGEEFGVGQDRDTSEYRRELRDAMRTRQGSKYRPVAASLFSTQSITADLYKIMRQIKQSRPAPANFIVGNNGTVRAVFPAAGTNIQFNRQTGSAPSFTSSFLPTPALNVIPGAVGQIAYGKFSSPDYQTPEKYIPATATLNGQPRPQGSSELVFQLFLPAGPKPATGWPVAIFGHGFTDSMYGAPWTVASVFAARGIATLSINVVGHGGGPLGSLTVLRSGTAPVVINAGGRGYDQDGNGSIDSTEGVNAMPPRSVLNNRDGLRQTVVDLMQLVREVEVGMDVDGDGSADLDAQRIYYAGQSFGGIYGTMLLGVEPNIQAGVPNVGGGSITEVARLGGFRPLTGISLASRVPSLINVADSSGIAFNENIPLRNQPPVINNVPGAMEIAKVLDRSEWAQQSANPVAYAAFIRKQPLPGNAAKPVLFQFGKGDQTVPNPTTTAILRAGDLADRAVLYRNDLAYAANPAVPKNPHTFLTNISVPAAAPYAIGAQQQIAEFFASHGTNIIDPDGPGPIFEVPVKLPLPEELNFIP
ncbi:Ig-like domain-containing protein [Noviherbaspirillum massiliense]|uniref:Ig-like domain-containing protein n=1 Tax=Noviherbaspirillum massiliense TaxID=1465823 RepID=UPI0002DD6DD0|nr:Ig-like domain-containing protein [Noviherbaspirillum massiliense]